MEYLENNPKRRMLFFPSEFCIPVPSKMDKVNGFILSVCQERPPVRP